MKYILMIIGLLTAVLLFRYIFSTEKMYNDAVDKAMASIDIHPTLITEEDLEVLPEPLKKYMIKVGLVGTPRVKMFKVLMTGEMKLDPDKQFAPVQVEQHTFTDTGQRLFYITMKYKGLKINGLHNYHAEDAFMVIKILDLIKVVDHSGPTMHKAETVTYFNDLCIMAPGALLDEDIIWHQISDRQVKGSLSKHGHTVSAVLTFNDEDMLVDFVSEDRLNIDKEGEFVSVPWSTPMDEFKQLGSYYLPNVGKAIWQYEDGDFTYIKLNIHDVSVN